MSQRKSPEDLCKSPSNLGGEPLSPAMDSIDSTDSIFNYAFLESEAIEGSSPASLMQHACTLSMIIMRMTLMTKTWWKQILY